MASPVALVTGGGSGIGLAVAEHLIQFHGYKVAILDMIEQRVKEAAVKLGDNCLALHVDITDYQAQAQAFLQTWEWAGCRLDLVVLNAGISDTDSLYLDSRGIDSQTGLPPPLDLRVFAVNLDAVLQGIHLARHFFSEKNSTPGGRIVVTASMLGLYANHSIPMYTASKHALVGLVRALAPVYAKDGITVNALCPALIETNVMAEEVRAMFDRKQWTPLSTALKAIDMVVVADKKLTGKAMELSLDRVNFKSQPDYSTENIRWACEQYTLWEMVAGSVLPRKPGQNTDLKEAV